MKRVILFVLLGIVLLGGIGTAQYINSTAEFVDLMATPGQIPDVDLSFAVLGDVHENLPALKDAIKDLYTINSAIDVLVLNGDTVDQGIPKQYTSVTKTLGKYKAFVPKQVIKNIGNHEYFSYDIETNTPEQVQTFINRYLKFAGENRVYHDTWINNYHFISLGSEDGNSDTLDSIKAFISEKQQQWLAQKLAEGYKKGKPIFVFLHQPLIQNGWGVEQSEEIKAILANYPEVVLFTSHSHRPLGNTSVTPDQPFTMVHTGSVHYTIVTSGGTRTREPYVEGLYVEVKGNQVTIKGRDFKKKTWLFSRVLNPPPKINI